MADRRELVLSAAEPLRLRTRIAGLFLFMPLLARLGFDELARDAGYPGSQMVPADAALISLLALKLLDKERRSHIDDFNFEEAAGVFAGLNVLPKKSFATAYSYRTGPSISGGYWRAGCDDSRRCCYPERRTSRWTSIPSLIAATRPSWRITTSPIGARLTRACSRSSPRSTTTGCSAMPTPT